jgi:hypothetical protein
MVYSLETAVERTAVIINVAKQHLSSVAVLLPAIRNVWSAAVLQAKSEDEGWSAQMYPVFE